MRRNSRVALALVLGCAGCPAVSPYACDEDAQCVRNGASGACQAETERCAFPDDVCASGLRYPSSIDGGFANECVDPLPASSSSSTTEPEVEPESSSSSTTTGNVCTLEPSEAITIIEDADALVAEAEIVTQGLPGVRVQQSPGVVVRDLDVTFSGSAGIVITDSPNATIERIRLHNAGAPKDGIAATSEIAIRVERSNGIQIRDIFVEDARSGVVVIDSEDVTLERIWVDDVRGDINTDGKGDDIGGDCVKLETSTRVELIGLGCTNDPSGFEPHAGVFVDRSSDVLVQDGIAENIDQQSGAGVRVHTNDGMSQGVVIRDFDTVGGTHACFEAVEGVDVLFENTGCRNQQGIGWLSSPPISGPVRAVGGRYYNVFEAVQCCSNEAFTEFDAAEDQFEPRLPPAVRPPCDP